MKALRYLLMVVAVMGVVSVYATAPQYGKPYNPGKRASYQGVQVQLPEATMGSTSSGIMYTGSSLPSAASEGVTTTYGPAKVGPRKVEVNPGGEPGPDEGENKEPWEDPIGDAVIPLLLLAGAYVLLRYVRASKRA